MTCIIYHSANRERSLLFVKSLYQQGLLQRNASCSCIDDPSVKGMVLRAVFDAVTQLPSLILSDGRHGNDRLTHYGD